MSAAHIDPERLRGDIQTLAAIGRHETDHGLYRMAFTANDWEARDWLRGRIEAAGLDFHEDGACNLHARYGDSDAPSVMSGSHIDTVPGAGHLDGALGVLCALEALRAARDAGIKTRYPLEAVAFSDEEGRFGGMFGSQAMSGRLTPEMIHGARDLDGVSLVEALGDSGRDAFAALTAQRRPESIRAFVELHIEQGPVLHRRGLKLGAVEAITGLFRWNVSLIGAANHAGTTPMDMRNDAFQGLAEFAVAIDRILEEHGSPRSRATIGRVELSPGAANVVPGRAEFSLEVRDTDPETLATLGEAFRRTLSAIARRRDLMFEFEVVSEITPVRCDAGVVATIVETAESLGQEPLVMSSGAAHDTQMMTYLAPAAMIFVPSKEGRSHHPAEWTAWDDIETGAEVLLHTLLRLANG